MENKGIILMTCLLLNKGEISSARKQVDDLLIKKGNYKTGCFLLEVITKICLIDDLPEEALKTAELAPIDATRTYLLNMVFRHSLGNKGGNLSIALKATQGLGIDLMPDDMAMFFLERKMLNEAICVIEDFSVAEKILSYSIIMLIISLRSAPLELNTIMKIAELIDTFGE